MKQTKLKSQNTHKKHNSPPAYHKTVKNKSKKSMYLHSRVFQYSAYHCEWVWFSECIKTQ